MSTKKHTKKASKKKISVRIFADPHISGDLAAPTFSNCSGLRPIFSSNVFSIGAHLQPSPEKLIIKDLASAVKRLSELI